MYRKRTIIKIIGLLFLLIPFSLRAEKQEDFKTKVEWEKLPTVAPTPPVHQDIRLRTNLLPWIAAVPNLGLEYVVGEKWSIVADVWFCPWKISDRYSLKTVTILPEGRWWIKSNRKGSFLNLHFDVSWFNLRANSYRYQDVSRPLLGTGIGYGYRLEMSDRWGFEFEIGAGVANTKYERYYNVPNGALKDTRVSTYWGIDRLSLAFVYYLCDL